MTIKQYLEPDDCNDFYIVNRKFSAEISVEDCKNLFIENKQHYRIMNEFEDSTWKIWNDSRDTFAIFYFNPILKKYAKKLKNFFTIKLFIQKNSISFLGNSLNRITQFLIYTKCLSPEYVEDYRLQLEQLTDSQKSKLFIFKQFLEFINEGYDYIELMEKANVYVTNNRDLPSFESIFLFDRLLNDFIEKGTTELIIKYYPVLLWWKLTTIIPLRPLEFVRIKRDCLFEKDEKHYIKIKREKNISHRVKYNVPIMTEFELNKDIFDFINTFVNYANSIDSDEYLISQKIYLSVLDTKYRKKHIFSYDDFSYLYDKFLSEIIEGIYHIKVKPLGEKIHENEMEKVKLGDSRHLAIINMMMQGVNPLQIMQLAGHHSLEAQMGYYNHVDKFMTSKTYVLSKTLSDKSFMTSYVEKVDLTSKDIDKKLMGSKFYKLPVVACGSGRCISNNFPYECESAECLFCKNFIPEKNVSKDYLKAVEQQNQNEIDLKKKTLEFLLKTSKESITELDELSFSLAALLNQKVIIETYKLNKEDAG